MSALVGTSQSTLSRELRRNSARNGHYLWREAQTKAEARRARTTTNSKKDSIIVWEALEHVRKDQWSPKQISGYMALHGKNISHELLYQYIRADKSGELEGNCRHRMKYNRHGRPERTTKVRNIPGRVSIHDRPAEADGERFGDWEMDTIIGKNNKGAIVTIVERSTDNLLMEKLPNGKDPKALAQVVARLLFPFRGKGLLTITSDNGSEFCAHQVISKLLGVPVFFADSYCSWQKGNIENENKLIRQYIPKGSDFDKITPLFICKIQAKINNRPREKLNFSTPKIEFYKHFS